jgi:hypothetical protein
MKLITPMLLLRALMLAASVSVYLNFWISQMNYSISEGELDPVSEDLKVE